MKPFVTILLIFSSLTFSFSQENIDTTIYEFPEVEAQFPDENSEFNQWFIKNLSFSEIDVEKHDISEFTKCTFSFVVKKMALYHN